MNNPFIDAVITDDPPKGGSERGNFWKKVAEIKTHRFDTSLLLLPTQRLAYMLFFSRIRRRVGVGHILYEVITLMDGVSRRKYNPLRHESDYVLDLARRIGARNIWTSPEIFIEGEEREQARKFLDRKGLATNGQIVLVHPGSGHSSPNWKVERYIELARLLSEAGPSVLVTGGGNEKDLELSFRQMYSRQVATSFGELTLRELASVISLVNLHISSSTGPMHIAGAVGTPTLSMFCPMDACSPKLWGPIGNESEIILPPQSFCEVKCPGDPHVCTFGDGNDGITVDAVFRAAMNFLKGREVLSEGIKQ